MIMLKYMSIKAAEANEMLITNYKAVLDSNDYDDIKNSGIIWRALSRIPPQQTKISDLTVIPWKRDKAQLMTIPVKVDGIINDFIFDTGANMSTISETYAEKLHLQVINCEFSLGSSTSIKNKSSLAIAENLSIGDIVISNVVFLVLPDDKLSFPQINYKINGIIGFPVFNQLGEIRISQNGIIEIPKQPGSREFKNLALDGLTPIISLTVNRNTLPFKFDSGAEASHFFQSYYKRYEESIKKTGKADTLSIGGAGGRIKYPAYVLNEVNVKTGNKLAILKKVKVITASEDNNDLFYGNIGQDFINHFGEMILNFKDMFVDFNLRPIYPK